jgi:hypothetical protein
MTIDEREDLAQLLPPPASEAYLPGASMRQQQLLREMTGPPRRRWRIPAPALAAGALAATVALAAVGGVVLRDRAVDPAAPATSLADLLAKIDKVTAGQEAVTARKSQYLYTRTKYLAPQATTWPSPEGGYTNVWMPVTSKTGEEYTDGDAFSSQIQRADDLSDRRPSKSMPALERAVRDPTFQRLSDALDVAPARILAQAKAVGSNDHDRNEQAFDKIRSLLRAGGLAQPAVRATLYHAAALVPGAYLGRPAVDALGRRGETIALKTGTIVQQILIDPATAELLTAGGGPLGFSNYRQNGPVSELEAAQAKLMSGENTGTAEVAHAIVDKSKQYPSSVHAPKAGPVEIGRRNELMTWPLEQPLRTIDWGNQSLSMPIDPHFCSMPRGSDGPPYAEFQNGVARFRGENGRHMRYDLDLNRRPVLYDGRLFGKAGSQVFTVGIRPADAPVSQSAYAVIAFDVDGGDLQLKLVAWIEAPAKAPTVMSQNGVVTVNGHGYHWNGKKFVTS